MKTARNFQTQRTIPFLMALFLLGLPTHAQYGGGTGEPDDPYLIYTAEQINAIGADPNDWDKHFKLMADIDLDPNLPGGRVFTQAVIHTRAMILSDFGGTIILSAFQGEFDGNDCTISNLTIRAKDRERVGLFSAIGTEGRVHHLVLDDIDIVAWRYAGGLAATNSGQINNCRVKGRLNGYDFLGGLVGINRGTIVDSGAAVDVRCDGKYPGDVGGLVGWHQDGRIARCCATGAVSAGDTGAWLGGLVGHTGSSGPYWRGEITDSYATGPVTAGAESCSLGGLVGYDRYGGFARCYASGKVAGGEGSAELGGLVGWGSSQSDTTACFWDAETSRQTTSAHGEARTTAEMQTIETFLDAGWDFVDETENGSNDVWTMPERDYPRLAWELLVADDVVIEVDDVVLVVDDFECYTNDRPDRIYQTWKDGLGYVVGDNVDYPGNDTGAIVGHDFWDDWPDCLMETEIVHGGQQSMPYYYYNECTPYYSEAERIFTMPRWDWCAVETPQDWTVDGADALTLHFCGERNNDADRLYVTIVDSAGGSATVIHPDADAVRGTRWQKWRIALDDLRAAGVDVTAVLKIIIGLGNRDNPGEGGSGLIYIDDIQVTRRGP